MWNKKPVSPGESAPYSAPEPARMTPSGAGGDGGARPKPSEAVPEVAVIGKGIVVKGEITGVDALFVDGRVEGTIAIAGERVTVAKNGQVIGGGSPGSAACISAREIVILGQVKGNISANEKVEIRAEGALTGDVSTARVSIEDGAYFRGGIDIRREESKSAAAPEPEAQRVPAI